MNLTLALDTLLTDTRYADELNQLRNLLPAGFLDQVDAAARDAKEVLHAIGDYIGADASTSGWAPVDRFPEWLRLGALDALAGWVTGRAATCRHNPSPDRAQPVVAAAWKPGLVVCPDCLRMTACRPGSLADRTCDGCGHECAGPDVGDGIWTGLVHVGVLVYQYGVCGGCKSALPRVA